MYKEEAIAQFECISQIRLGGLSATMGHLIQLVFGLRFQPENYRIRSRMTTDSTARFHLASGIPLLYDTCNQKRR
jgi:hypothetical protein